MQYIHIARLTDISVERPQKGVGLIILTIIRPPPDAILNKTDSNDRMRLVRPLYGVLG